MNDTRARELVAELYILGRYDDIRSGLGHDFGQGTRAGELRRRRRELEQHRPDVLNTLAPFTRDELAAAYDRVGAKRCRRALRDADLYGSAGAQRTARAWERIRNTYYHEGRAPHDHS